MKNPPSPAEVLKGLYLEPLSLSVNEAAEALDVPIEVINGTRPITPDNASKIVKVFGGRVQTWVNMQEKYDRKSRCKGN